MINLAILLTITSGDAGEVITRISHRKPGSRYQSAPIQLKFSSEITPLINEPRLLYLEWPPMIRIGDTDVIRLSFDPDDTTNLVSYGVAAWKKTRDEAIVSPDVYEMYTVIASARLEIASLQVEPNDQIEIPLLPGERIEFSWKLSPGKPGTYHGTVWLYLIFIPIDGGHRIQKPLTAQRINIESMDFFGLSGPSARLLGCVGIIAGLLMGLKAFHSPINTSKYY